MKQQQSTNTNKQQPAAKLYGRALFELAQETNQLDSVRQELEGLVALLNEQPELNRALSAFMFPVNERQALAEKVASTAQISPLLSRFMQLLIGKSRFEIVPGVLAAFQQLLDEKNGVVRGNVLTATQINGEELTQLTEAFSRKLNKKVILEPELDASILGGLVVQIEGKTFDGSLRTTIHNLKASLERQSI